MLLNMNELQQKYKKNNKILFSKFKNKVLNYLLNYYDVTEMEFIENINRNKRPFVIIRQILMKLAKEHGHSLYNAGAIFDKDHATVLHAIKVVGNLIDTDKEFAILMKNVDEIVKECLSYNVKKITELEIVCNGKTVYLNNDLSNGFTQEFQNEGKTLKIFI